MISLELKEFAKKCKEMGGNFRVNEENNKLVCENLNLNLVSDSDLDGGD